MTLNFYVEYLLKTRQFKLTRDLFNNICGLDLEILNVYGEKKEINRAFRRNPSLDRPLAKVMEAVHLESTNCSSWLGLVPQEFVAIGIDQQVTQNFNVDGLKNLLVPIKCRNEVVAFLFTREKKDLRLSTSKLAIIQDFLENFVEQLAENDLKKMASYEGNPLTYQEKVISRITQYIDDNYHKPNLTLTKISSMFGINYHYLSRLFKHELNTSFSKYVTGIRVDVASRLLMDKSLSVSQVSYSCGFEDPGYFCKVFKKSRGTTPADYRSGNETVGNLTTTKRF